jgi:hypothetical protein
VKELLFASVRVYFVVLEVIPMRVGLHEAVAQAPGVEAEYRREAQPVAAGLKMAAGPVLREICEFYLRPILSARAERVKVFEASVNPVCRLSRFCRPSSMLSIATETMPRQQ